MSPPIVKAKAGLLLDPSLLSRSPGRLPQLEWYRRPRPPRSTVERHLLRLISVLLGLCFTAIFLDMMHQMPMVGYIHLFRSTARTIGQLFTELPEKMFFCVLVALVLLYYLFKMLRQMAKDYRALSRPLAAHTRLAHYG